MNAVTWPQERLAKRILRVRRHGSVELRPFPPPTRFPRIDCVTAACPVATSPSHSQVQLAPVEGPVTQPRQGECVVCLPTLPCPSDLAHWSRSLLSPIYPHFRPWRGQGGGDLPGFLRGGRAVAGHRWPRREQRSGGTVIQECRKPRGCQSLPAKHLCH